MRNFREIRVWKSGIELTKDLYKISQKLPESEKYGLCSQMQRSGVSIPSNIAEGASRSSEKDFCRFLEIALGSAFEVETQVIIGKELNFLPDADYKAILSELHSIQKQINSLISVIRKSQ